MAIKSDLLASPPIPGRLRIRVLDARPIVTDINGEVAMTVVPAIVAGPLDVEAFERLLPYVRNQIELPDSCPEFFQVFDGQKSDKQTALPGDGEVGLVLLNVEECASSRSNNLGLRGRITAAVGLERFTSLATLRLASQVKKGYDLRALPKLESIEAVWQPDLAAAFEHPTLRSLTIRSFPVASLDEIRIDPDSKLSRLWIADSKLEGLAGIERLRRLEELRITDAKRLASLAGLRNPLLRSLDIENAAPLADLSSLDGAPRLKLLRLLSTSTDIDLAAVHELDALESLQVGGRVAADLDWMRIASSPTLKRVFAWWNPEVATEAQIRERASEMGRSIQQFEPVAGRGRRPVLVEWACLPSGP